VSNDVIPPGGEGEIKASLKTAGRSGPIKKRITVTSDDPATPRLVLTLEGEIVVDVETKPRRVSYGQLGKGEKGTQEFAIEVREPDKVKITKVAIDDDRFNLKRKDGDSAGNATYELEFLGTDELGRVNATVVVEFSGSDVSKIDLPVRASVVGDLVYRRSVNFFKKDGKFDEKEFVIGSRSNRKVKILGLEDPDKHLKLEIINKKGKEGAWIKAGLTNPEASFDKVQRGKIIIKTDDPSEPVIEMRYSISDRSRLSRSPRIPGAKLDRAPKRVKRLSPDDMPGSPSKGERR